MRIDSAVRNVLIWVTVWSDGSTRLGMNPWNGESEGRVISVEHRRKADKEDSKAQGLMVFGCILGVSGLNMLVPAYNVGVNGDDGGGMYCETGIFARRYNINRGELPAPLNEKVRERHHERQKPRRQLPIQRRGILRIEHEGRVRTLPPSPAQLDAA